VLSLFDTPLAGRALLQVDSNHVLKTPDVVYSIVIINIAIRLLDIFPLINRGIGLKREEERQLVNVRMVHVRCMHPFPDSTAALREHASPSETHYSDIPMYVCRSSEACASC
jgi:hypothetical protein